MVYPLLIALIGPKHYFSRKKVLTKKNRAIHFTNIMVTEKKTYTWKCNWIYMGKQCTAGLSIPFMRGLNHLQLNHLQN